MMQSPAVGADLPGVDFKVLSQGFGLHAVSAGSVEAARSHLERMFSEPGPFLLELNILP